MRLSLLLPLILVAACVTPKFDAGRVSQLQPGISTRADAERLLGPSSAQSRSADGSTILQWIDVQGGILNQAHAAHVAIVFNPDGTMNRVAHRYEKNNRPFQ